VPGSAYGEGNLNSSSSAAGTAVAFSASTTRAAWPLGAGFEWAIAQFTHTVNGTRSSVRFSQR
jgi:hypothetical protein